MSLPLEARISQISPETSPSKRPALALSSARLADTAQGDKAGGISPTVVRGLVRFTDFALVALIGVVIALFYIDETAVAQNPRYLAAVVFTGAATITAFELLDLYSLRAFSSFVLRMPRVVLGWSLAFAALVIGIFLLKIGADISRVWLTTWYVAGAATLVAWRLAIAWTMRGWAKSGRLYQRAVIYGAG
ncbi:MAG: undecaprenyl-phosphate glucose phosphotransferase, partial [Hyphomicrobium sp.]